MVEALGCSNDDFIRTTEERHHRSSEAIWQRMQKNGDIYLDKYAGWYSVRDEAYYAEDETQLERAEGAARPAKPGTPVEWVEEESYFFRLSAYQQKLLDLYASVPDFVLPKERLNEVASFVRGGLQDLSISRTTFDWGIRCRATQARHVCVGRRADQLHHRRRLSRHRERKVQALLAGGLHVIGKDIVRFHAVYWPAFLMSAGIEVPQRIFSHGFLFNRGEKMSKSVGNVIDPFALADAYGVDPLRYFFLREVPFGQDGNYSHEAIVNRINADLANDLGNLAQRSLSMIGKAFGGVLPEPGEFSDNDKAILAAADGMIGAAREHMKTQQLHQVLNAVWAVVADANRYFAGEAPWALAKTDPARQGTVLYVTAEVLRQVAILSSRSCRRRRQTARSARRCSGQSNAAFRCLGNADGRPRATLPAPAPVFPALCRAGSREGVTAMLVDSHCHLDFPDFEAELDAVVARARAAGIGRMVTISTRVRRHAQVLAIAEAISRTSFARSAPIRITPTRNSTSAPTRWSSARNIPKWWRSARPGSIITTTTARARRRSRASATTSRRRARPACRW